MSCADPQEVAALLMRSAEMIRDGQYSRAVPRVADAAGLLGDLCREIGIGVIGLDRPSPLGYTLPSRITS